MSTNGSAVGKERDRRSVDGRICCEERVKEWRVTREGRNTMMEWSYHWTHRKHSSFLWGMSIHQKKRQRYLIHCTKDDLSLSRKSEIQFVSHLTSKVTKGTGGIKRREDDYREIRSIDCILPFQEKYRILHHSSEKINKEWRRDQLISDISAINSHCRNLMGFILVE